MHTKVETLCDIPNAFIQAEMLDIGDGKEPVTMKITGVLVSILPGKILVRGPPFLMVGPTDSSTFCTSQRQKLLMCRHLPTNNIDTLVEQGPT